MNNVEDSLKRVINTYQEEFEELYNIADTIISKAKNRYNIEAIDENKTQYSANDPRYDFKGVMWIQEDPNKDLFTIVCDEINRKYTITIAFDANMKGKSITVEKKYNKNRINKINSIEVLYSDENQFHKKNFEELIIYRKINKIKYGMYINTDYEQKEVSYWIEKRDRQSDISEDDFYKVRIRHIALMNVPKRIYKRIYRSKGEPFDVRDF